VFIGAKSGYCATTSVFQNVILIGADVAPQADNTTVIGNDNTTNAVIRGCSYGNVSAPASNSAAGANGQWATGITDGTNFLFFYDPDGGGTGTGRWLRVEGSVTW
jgi:hypothetical protein